METSTVGHPRLQGYLEQRNLGSGRATRPGTQPRATGDEHASCL